jgi:hypothetical protein
LPIEPHLDCVLLPCSNGETWAVPLNSVAEVVVGGDWRSERLRWRGRELPCYPSGQAEQNGGIYAVMVGLGDLAGDHWAVCLRNQALAYLPLAETDTIQLPGDTSPNADILAVFAVAGKTCVVPDLGALQLRLYASAPPSSW